MPSQPTIAPERKRIFLFLLTGSCLLILGVFLLLIISSLYVTFAPGRLIMCGICFLLLAMILTLWRRSHYQLAAYLLVLFYGTLATVVLALWGINTPFGELLMAVTIVVAGILLGPRHSLYTAATASLILFALQFLNEIGVHKPQLSTSLSPPVYGDALGYGIIFGILALVSWLFGETMERSLRKAQTAEAALLQEKATLEVRVAERTLELEALQFQEMQQLYRFAEMGQLSAALLHDLANQLTVLTLDIQDLQDRTPRSEALSRARHSVRHLEHMIDRVQSQLQGENAQRRFSVAGRIKDTLQLLKQKTRGKRISLEFTAREKTTLLLHGDPTRFSQAIAILVTNAIDAYEKVTTKQKKVITVELERKNGYYLITVTDRGIGIPQKVRAQLFQPFYSTKQTGMGIGLFIAKEIIEKHFAGHLALSDATDRTAFVIQLPIDAKR